ncbi:MAG TPA: stage II sporulation protein M [Vicinamibacterales bacterium]|nr:stage II sporulation protein M [Vicinamibacterales bacterium]
MASPVVSSRWIEKRKAHWTRLEALLTRSQRGVSALTHDELRELALLYRQTAADLSSAREHRVDAQLAAYLNQLLGRAHNLIYTGVRPRPRGVLRFYAVTFPQVFRATWRYTLAATLLFAAGAAAGTGLSIVDPGFQRFVLGGQMMDTIERREMWTHGIVAIKPIASSAITTNNLSVSFAAFALGVTAGIGTAWMMLLNGVLIGVIGVACFRAGLSLSLWSFVAPHGALELPAIFIAGGAGLILARGLLDPGTLPRRESLAHAGRRAVRLLLGVIPLLIVAGAIEGFVSPEAFPPLAKFAIGASMLVLLILYLIGAGRQATEAPAP